MRRLAFSLVELLVALAVGSLLLVGASRLLATTVRTSKTEGATFRSQQEALAALEGLEKETQGKGVGAVLPGSGENLLSLVLLGGNGHPVLIKGYSASGFRIAASSQPEFQPGDTILLRNAAGQAALLSVTELTQLDPDTWEVSLGGCQNPVIWSENARAFKAETLTLEYASGTLKLTTKDGTVEVAQIPEFKVSYVYRTPDGQETLSTAYQGLTLNTGAKLAAVSLFAKGYLAGNRALTARFHVPRTATEVIACGAQNPSQGLGVVTVVVSPAPPGGGDLTLGATSYTRNFRNTSTFNDVPAGPLSITAREVWTDALTAWAPSPASWTGRLYSFYPLTVAVQYAIVPGTIAFSASGFPADGSTTVSAGPYSASLGGGGTQSVSAMPGVYGTSASAEVSVSRSQGSVSWTEVYTLQSVSPAQATVRSYGTVSVSATYSGPLPGTLCYDGNCQQASPGRYTAPGESVVRTWTNTYTQSCPSGQTGSITVTEQWRTVKYWTPGEGGLSSRGTLNFQSATRDEMVSSQEQNNCTTPPPSSTTPPPSSTTPPPPSTTPPPPSTNPPPSRQSGTLVLEAVLATPLGGDPNPDIEAGGLRMYRHQTWGRASYTVPAGTYNVTARSISKEFTRNGLTYRAEYTATVSPASVTVPAGGTASATATYTATPGTFCDFTGCRSVLPGVHYPSGNSCQSTNTYDSTDFGDYYLIVRTFERRCWFAEYDPNIYPVSSNQTVRATGVQSPWLITAHRHTVERKSKSDVSTTVITDILNEFQWRYDPVRDNWEVSCNRATDYVAGTTTTFPEGCW